MLSMISGSQHNGSRCKMIVFMKVNVWSFLPFIDAIKKMTAKC